MHITTLEMQIHDVPILLVMAILGQLYLSSLLRLVKVLEILILYRPGHARHDPWTLCGATHLNLQ